MSHNINIHHITRVEGHGNLVINIRERRIEELRLEIVESPRFFEVMLRGRHITEAPHITSRICGICAISHTEASLRACEDALNITPSEEVILLRKLLLHLEILQSHILHLYLLALPDLMNVPSVIPLIRTHPEIVRQGLRLKKIANSACAILVGRHVHPVGMVIGGFKKGPSYRDLSEIQKLLMEGIPYMEKTISLFKDFNFPPIDNETIYCSLKDPDEYALYGGTLYSSNGDQQPPWRYKTFIHEEVIAYSTAKHAKKNGKSIMVGAISRLNNNFSNLSNEAKDAARKLGLNIPCHNPFYNNFAQIVEATHCIYDSLKIIDRLLQKDLTRVLAPQKISTSSIKGHGIGVVEAPRGTLYHDYEVDSNGIIHNANCIIPTAQNLRNLERDIEVFVPRILDMPEEGIVKSLEMLVRAYDPCISCSTHFLNVKFER